MYIAEKQTCLGREHDGLKLGGHIPVLDGLRGVAILLVLLCHFYRKPFISSSYPIVTNIMGRVTEMGAYGVELFFVLSGFLITGILLDTKHDPHFFRKFYIRRILRIFPLYYGALAVVLIILPHFIQFDSGATRIVSNQIWLWTYLANWPKPGWIWDDSALFLLGHFWSLSVEEHFYCLWPSLVALFSPRALLRICATLLALAIGSRTFFLIAGAQAPVLFQWNTLHKMDGLIIGALIAIALRDKSLAALLPRGRSFKRMLIFISGLVLTYIWLPRKWHLAAFDIFSETLISLFFGLILLLALRSYSFQIWNRLLTSKVLVAFGKYSYGLYVIHGIMRPCFARIFDPSGLPQSLGLPILYVVGYWVVTIGISFGLAYLSYHAFEKRFLALKRYVEYRDEPAVHFRENQPAVTPVP